MMENSLLNKDIQVRRILIVDDNYKNIELAVSLLQSEDYEIAIANSGGNALEILQEFVPDLILLDVMMPEMDGFEVCSKLKQNHKFKDIPVIFLTAKSELDDILQGFRVGGVDYIKKPFNQDELLMRVKTHVDLKKASELVRVQNEEQSALMSITAHDLKNPLQAIWGLLDVLESKLDILEKEEILEILLDIKSSTKTAIHITKDILDLHKYESGKFNFKLTSISILDLITPMLDLYNRIAKDKGIRIHFENTCQNTIALLDKNKFERIIDNLVSNAIKFSPFDANIFIKIFNESNNLVISIKDEGPGLTEKDKELAFKKFAKLSAKPTGGETSSGLGLSIVKLLVEAMGGTVGFNTELNTGAEFIVQFPVKAQ